VGHYLYDRFFYSTENWALIAKSVPVLALALILTATAGAKPFLNYLLPLVALAGWAVIVIKREEYRYAVRSIAGLFSRSRR